MTEDDAKDYRIYNAHRHTAGPYCLCSLATLGTRIHTDHTDAMRMYCFDCGNGWDAFARTATAPPYNDGTRPEETI
jgi:hypothetical protein